MIDIVGELDRIEYFKSAGVNENGGNDKVDNPPDEIAPACNECAGADGNYCGRNQDRCQNRPKDLPARHLSRKCPTHNVQLARQQSFDIGCSVLSVRRFLHLLFFSQASQPPSSTNTSGSCASFRNRSATSRARSQLCVLQ